MTAVPPAEEVQLYDGEGQGAGMGQDQDAYYAEVQLEAEVLEVLAEGFSDCSPESLQVNGRSKCGKRFTPCWLRLVV